MSKKTILDALFDAADALPGEWKVDLCDLECKFEGSCLKLLLYVDDGDGLTLKVDDGPTFSEKAISADLAKALRGHHRAIVAKATAAAFQDIKAMTAGALERHEAALGRERAAAKEKVEREEARKAVSAYWDTTDLQERLQKVVAEDEALYAEWEAAGSPPDSDPGDAKFELELPYDEQAWAALLRPAEEYAAQQYAATRTATMLNERATVFRWRAEGLLDVAKPGVLRFSARAAS